MFCCLNPACNNPSVPDGTNFCPSCGVPLIMLRNRYRPIKFLGSGTFGKTYLAEDIDKLNQKCVIKQFAPKVEGTEGLQKATELFDQEARRLELLGEHPQIPTLLAYFQEDSRLYLVQQFIDGQNLFKQLQLQGVFSEEKIENLLLDLLNILKFVHKQEVIHRDIKPENIIQRSDNTVVLIDFGASKQLTKTEMTEEGTIIGSFGYGSLEQIERGEASPASDLYSLGTTCFHLLSGIHPSTLCKQQGYSWVRSWRQHLQQPVGHELGQILDKLLQQDYQQRYQSAEEILQILNLPPPLLKFPQLPQLNQLLQSRTPLHKTFPIYFFVISLTVFIRSGIVYLPQFPQNAETYKHKAIEKYNKQNFRGAIEDYNQAIEINPNDADTYKKRGNARIALGDYQVAIEDYNQAIDINPNDAKAYKGRGLARSKLGEKQAAIEDYNRVIKINPNDAKAYIRRGLIRSKLGDKQAAIKDLGKAADLYKQQGKETDYQNALNHIKKIEK